MTAEHKAHGSMKLRFEGGAGHELDARLEMPSKPVRAVALFSPCFTCLKDSKAIVHISRALTNNGIAVLRYDVTGIGASGGDFAGTTFTTQIDDLLAAARAVQQHTGEATLLLGISLGGAVAVAASRRLPGVRAVVTINAPANTAHLRSTLMRVAPRALAEGSQEVDLLGRRVVIGGALINDLADHDITTAAAELGRPLLVVHAAEDEIVPLAHGEHLFNAAQQPKAMVAVDKSDHLMLRDRDAAPWIGEVISAWFSRFNG